MNWFDIILLAVFVLFTVVGIWRGFLSMVLPLVGLIVGIVLAGHHAAAVGNWFPIDNPEYAQWTGYTIIVVGTLIISILLAAILSRFISIIFLKWFDRLMGGIFGLATGVLLCAAALAASVKYGLGEDFIQGSGIAQLLLDWIPGILVLLPAEFDSVKEFFQ
jgi:membrane protein required for colicin V production